MKLNQFSFVGRVKSTSINQSKSGMTICEIMAETLDGKYTMAFTAFKDKAQALADSMKHNETWLFSGSLSGRTYTDKNGGVRVANGLTVNDASKLTSQLTQAASTAPTFDNEDVPF